MNPDNIQTFLGTLLITIAGLGAASFVWQYSRHFAWYESFPGRALMGAQAAILLVMTYLTVGRWLDFDSETREWVSLAVFAPLALVQVALSIALYRHRTGKDKRITDMESADHG